MKTKTVLQFDDKDVADWPKEIEESFNLCYNFCTEIHVDYKSPSQEKVHPVRKSLNKITSSSRAEFEWEDVLNLHEYAASVVYNRMMEAIEEGTTPAPDAVKQNAERLINTLKRFTLVCRNALKIPNTPSR